MKKKRTSGNDINIPADQVIEIVKVRRPGYIIIEYLPQVKYIKRNYSAPEGKKRGLGTTLRNLRQN